MNDIEALAGRILLIGNGTLLYDGSLNALRSRFNTRKSITIDYRETTDPLLLQGTQVLSWSPERAVLSIDTEQVMISDIISQLSSRVELLDVAVEAQPIEEIIVQLYKEYRI
jgi:ABC-2 type transport system ATP-binding protein